MRFSEFVGHEDAKLALILNAIDPRCGGVLFLGEKGTGKSTLARLFKEIVPEGTRFLELPMNVTEDGILGGVDIEETVRSGVRVYRPGILERVNGGILFVDDINLLPPEMIAFLLEVQDRGEEIVEREGMSLRYPSVFIMVATMNPEEGELSPHLLDHFGMCVLWKGLRDRMDRMDVMRISSEEIFQRIPKTDEELRRRIELSRKRLGDITVPEDIELYIVQTCMENGVSGHRADIFLFYAARAYAAFCGDGILGREHVDAVAPLVLAHRRRMAQQMEEMEEEQEHRHEHGDEGDSDTPPHDTRPKGKGLEEFGSADSYRIEANPKEDVFEIGTTFRTRRISFKRDRIKRLALGRRTKTISKGKGGRYVRSVMDPREKDIAIDATLRAAAPFQSFRRMDATYPTAIVIKPEDLRFKRKERRMRHIVVFVVDGSGSMGVKRRMREVKGAIQSLLVDCYQKRDRVAMIVFRRDGAELVLPPTSSVEMASKKLKDIPTGGRTPLSAGLFEAYKLIRRTYIKEKETRFAVVLVTDGRANRSISGLPIDEELERIAGILRGLSGVDYIVVDTEDKKGFLRTDLALKIASLLNAYYFRMEDLRSDLLADIARFAKRNEEGVRCAVPVD